MQNINWELSKKKTLGGFTLIEVLVVVFVLSMGVIVIMQGIHKTTTYISETAQRTIALRLAREGIEGMYNIRNTNWRRRSDSRDKCWLKANPMVDEGNPGCEDDPWIHYVRGILLSQELGGNTYYRYAHTANWVTNDPTFPDEHRNCGRYQYEIQTTNLRKRVDWDLMKWTRDPGDWHKWYQLHFIDWDWIDHQEYEKRGSPKTDTSMWRFWRYIRVQWLYSKNAVEPNGPNSRNGCLACTRWIGPDPSCWDDNPKELRFCSFVIYKGKNIWSVEVCSIMTNFLK